MDSLMYPLIGLGVLAVFGFAAVILSFLFRTVVPTNKVHIVQSGKKTISYGAGQPVGNVYYAIPSFVPVFGVTSISLPVSNFDLHLQNYKAYDKERVPFELDLTAFFRIADTNRAAERVSSMESLMQQLQSVVQGAARKILASYDINQIMTDRATFGEQFTKEVAGELENWGVTPVKNMELMDIRDSEGSKVIAAIMSKKTSHITMESRQEVARNDRAAQVTEIESAREVAVEKEAANQLLGQRTAERQLQVGVANEAAKQRIGEAQAITAARDADVRQVTTVRNAQIDSEAAIVAAEQAKRQTVLNAEARLEADKRQAQSVQINGEAAAAARTAMELAPVTAQVTLAKEIGGNQGYQQYLISLETVRAYVQVGQAQAGALQQADVKIIANAGSASEGITSVGGVFTPQGGTNIAAMLEGIANSPVGKQLLDSVLSPKK